MQNKPKTSDFNKVADKLEIKLNKKVNNIASYAQQLLIYGTPVDTGRARNNWFVTLGSASNEKEGEYASSESLNGAKTQKRINDNNTVIHSRKDDSPIFITNNVNYVKYLNNGSSAQAPQGFVQKAIDNAINLGSKDK